MTLAGYGDSRSGTPKHAKLIRSRRAVKDSLKSSVSLLFIVPRVDWSTSRLCNSR